MIVVAGVGRRDRGDDAVGLAVAESLGDLGPDTTVRTTDEPLDLLEWWSGSDLAVVVDAVRAGGAPGTVHVIELGAAGLSSVAGASSSHVLGVAAAWRLATSLGRAAKRTVVVGVEPASTGFGVGLSDAASDAVAPAGDLVREIVASARRDATALG